jgi:hypothetical protein
MTLSDFLRDHIEGYLLGDIDGLMGVPVPNGRDAGGLGYPLVMTVLSGVELLGALTEAGQNPGAAFDKEAGARYFGIYWKAMLYPQSPKLAPLHHPMYLLARHGLMHSFTVKGPFEVSKVPEGRPLHLTESATGTRHINCNQLADDFRESYIQRFKPFAQAHVSKVEKRLNDMAIEYAAFAQKTLSSAAQFPKAPAQAPSVSVSQATFTVVNVTSSWKP